MYDCMYFHYIVEEGGFKMAIESHAHFPCSFSIHPLPCPSSSFFLTTISNFLISLFRLSSCVLFSAIICRLLSCSPLSTQGIYYIIMLSFIFANFVSIRFATSNTLDWIEFQAFSVQI